MQKNKTLQVRQGIRRVLPSTKRYAENHIPLEEKKLTHLTDHEEKLAIQNKLTKLREIAVAPVEKPEEQKMEIKFGNGAIVLIEDGVNHKNDVQKFFLIDGTCFKSEIVPPDHLPIEEDTPLAKALIGAKKGDTVTYTLTNGKNCTARVLKIFLPSVAIAMFKGKNMFEGFEAKIAEKTTL
jgi:transcription elongation GreA/GreB family factor